MSRLQRQTLHARRGSPSLLDDWPWKAGNPAWPATMANGRPWPTVSIVTPSFNHAKFLEATIRSVVCQGYPNLDYLIMDGGSTDESVAIIRRYASALSYWVSESDAGQADAINKGWRRAQGEILAYLNSDDLYLPHAIRRVVECFVQHPEVDLVYGSLQVVDEQGRPAGKSVEVPDVSLSWLLRRPIPQPTMFIRRSVVERIGLFDPSLYYVFDWDFCLRAAVAGIRMARIPGAPLAAFRSWTNQKTADGFERQVQEQLWIRDRLLTNPDLPRQRIGEVRFSKAWAFLWPAYQCYRMGRRQHARQLLHQAVAVHRRIMLQPGFLGLYARTLLGSRLTTRVRRIKARLTGRVPG